MEWKKKNEKKSEKRIENEGKKVHNKNIESKEYQIERVFLDKCTFLEAMERLVCAHLKQDLRQDLEAKRQETEWQGREQQEAERQETEWQGREQQEAERQETEQPEAECPEVEQPKTQQPEAEQAKAEPKG